MRLLLLAGSSEARQIAEALAGREGLEVVASLAGATRTPGALPCMTRTGGFGGEAGFAKFLEDNAIDAVLDATHPFATRISARSAGICLARGLPFLHLARPEWEAGPGDRWTMIADEAEAAQHVAPGASVFLATGRQRLEAFAALSGRRVICRRIDTPEAPFPFPGGAWLVARPPFRVEDEIRLFGDLGIDVLVMRNAGGAASRPKLDAARALGLPVLMIRRPAPPDCPRVANVAEAVHWVEELRA